MRLIMLSVVLCALTIACRPKGSSLKDEPEGRNDPLWAAFNENFTCNTQYLDETERLGCYVWYFGTFGNAKYHSYVLPQRLGLLADYYDVFASERRGRSRFKKWGIISDPSCIPANEARERYGVESYGFDVCPGDLGSSGLLAAVGNPDAWHKYRGNGDFAYWKNDPGCDLGDCEIQLGTSAGALGFRKFPNPKFNKQRWEAAGGWEGYSKRGGLLSDGSIDPPFTIGHACGSCHIAFNPESPNVDPENPTWADIKGGVGNQYLHISELLGSGMPTDSLEWQVFTHIRPGVTDTSAVTHDNVHNPGTINAVLNFNTRPGLVNHPAFRGIVMEDEHTTYQPPKHRYKYYGLNGEAGWKNYNDVVPQVLKGGEDSVGAAGAVQRVYINIGVCAEACMVNHIQDLRALVGRGSRQTPFRTDQCFRDCPSYRSIAKLTTPVFAFLAAQRPFELYKAKGFESRDEFIERELGRDKVDKGAQLYAAHCARCHSSRVNPEEANNPQLLVRKLSRPSIGGRPNPFYLLAEKDGVRLDWLGNDARVPASEVETFRCRSLHSNHMKGHLWEQYGSKTLRQGLGQVSGIPELRRGDPGGRGYYRNISLLSLWAFAPFLHNNALGPDLCSDDFPMGTGPCLPADPTLNGRLKLFKQSVDQLLFKTRRAQKVTRTDKDIVVPLGPRIQLPSRGSDEMRGVELRVPRGSPVTLLGSIDQRKMVDKILNDIDRADTPQQGFAEFTSRMQSLYQRGGEGLGEYLKTQGYINCGHPLNEQAGSSMEDIYEDRGHNFVEFDAGAPDDIFDKKLNEAEYQALLAFLQLL